MATRSPSPASPPRARPAVIPPTATTAAAERQRAPAAAPSTRRTTTPWVSNLGESRGLTDCTRGATLEVSTRHRKGVCRCNSVRPRWSVRRPVDRRPRRCRRTWRARPLHPARLVGWHRGTRERPRSTHRPWATQRLGPGGGGPRVRALHRGLVVSGPGRSDPSERRQTAARTVRTVVPMPDQLAAIDRFLDATRAPIAPGPCPTLAGRRLGPRTRPPRLPSPRHDQQRPRCHVRAARRLHHARRRPRPRRRDRGRLTDLPVVGRPRARLRRRPQRRGGDDGAGPRGAAGWPGARSRTPPAGPMRLCSTRGWPPTASAPWPSGERTAVTPASSSPPAPTAACSGSTTTWPRPSPCGRPFRRRAPTCLYAPGHQRASTRSAPWCPRSTAR